MRRIVGFIALLMGLLWAAQGAGIFPYPASSFMVDNSRWIYYGLGVAVFGLVLIVWRRR